MKRNRRHLHRHCHKHSHVYRRRYHRHAFLVESAHRESFHYHGKSAQMEGAVSETSLPGGRKRSPAYIKPYKRMAYGGTPEWAGDRPSYFLPGQCSYVLAKRHLVNRNSGNTDEVDGEDDTETNTENPITGILKKFHSSRRVKRADIFCTGLALEYSPTYQENKWNNTDTGFSFTVTPTRTYQRDGEICREFHAISVKGDKTREVDGTACRNKQGGWTIVKQDSSL